MYLAASFISTRPFKPQQHSLHRATQAIYNCRCRGLPSRQIPPVPPAAACPPLPTMTTTDCQQSILEFSNTTMFQFRFSRTQASPPPPPPPRGGGGGGGCGEASSSSLSRTDVRNYGTHEKRVMHPFVRLSS